MAWREITEADVLTRISGPELEAFREAALDDNQPDPVAGIIGQITNEVRSYVAACEKNKIGPEGEIPESLLGTSLDLILIEIQTRAAGILIDPEDVRKDKMKRAERRLRDVAACNFAIEQPATESEESFAGSTPATIKPDRFYNRASQDGI